MTLRILYRSSSQALRCGVGPRQVRAMAEALVRTVPASRYWPSMELHPMFRADVSAKDAAFLHSRTA